MWGAHLSLFCAVFVYFYSDDVFRVPFGDVFMTTGQVSLAALA